MGCFSRGCSFVRANIAGGNRATRSIKPNRSPRKSARICFSGRALWFASCVLRLVRSAVVRVSHSVRKSCTRAFHNDSRSSRCPACSWIDHWSPDFAVRRSCGTSRNSPSSRAGVPRRRAQRLGYCSTGKVNSNFRSNQTGTWLIGGPEAEAGLASLLRNLRVICREVLVVLEVENFALAVGSDHGLGFVDRLL